MVRTLLDEDSIPAAERIDRLFERWYEVHPSHRPTIHHRPVTLARLHEKGKDLQRISSELRSACVAACRADRYRQYKDIAAELGMVPSTVQKYAFAAGLTRLHAKKPLKPKKNKWARSTSHAAELRCARIDALLGKGLSQNAIARELGIRRHTVAYYLKPTCKARLRTADLAA